MLAEDRLSNYIAHSNQITHPLKSTGQAENVTQSNCEITFKNTLQLMLLTKNP